MVRNELYHHGIPGQKKGLRRFQNPDGSLTELGRIHYGYKARRSNSKVAELSGKKSNDVDAKEINRSINTTRSTARIANKYVNKYEDTKYQKKLSKMSDAELEKEIQKALPEYRAKEIRRQLENRYEVVVGNPHSTKVGREKALAALDVMSDVALITMAATPIVKAIGKYVMNKVDS